MSSNAPPKPTLKEHFDMLLAAQIKFRDGVVESGFKVAAALTVFLGWILTANSAQTFLKQSPFGLWLFCLAVAGFGTWMIVANFFRAREETTRLYEQLCGLNYFERSSLTQFALKPRLFWAVLSLNLVLCALLIGGMFVVRVT